MDNLLHRLASYIDTELFVGCESTLAANGLHYNKTSSTLECCKCGFKLNTWISLEDTIGKHAQQPCSWNAQHARTPFLLHISTSNMLQNVELPLAAPPVEQQPLTPDFKKLEKLDERLKTFEGRWPSNCKQKPEDLAKAGFFLLQAKHDRVQCAYCKGILRNWEPHDIPLQEHIKHFPDCSFARELFSNAQGHDHKLTEENKQLKEARQCKICIDAEIDCVFLPCGHLISCSVCAPKLRTCPVCRAFIRGTVKIFLS